jgi:ABC-type sugar transport system ATPase subunit
MKSTPLLRLTNIFKSFGGVKALSGVSLTAHSGEVHAVVGENGAGKSTLMKIISGALRPDSGQIEWNGTEYTFQEPRDASKLGIAIVYQEPLYFNDLSVVENLFLGEEIKKPNGTLDWKSMTEQGVDALRRIGLPSEIIRKPMSELSLGVKQLVLIARAVQRNARLLILDEPTAILSQRETEILFQTMHTLKKNHVSILYISHRLAEIFEIADYVTVLRDGHVVMESKVSETNENELISAMTGRKISTEIYFPRDFQQQETLLSVHNLTCEGYYSNISFAVKPKQILAFYGLVGAGRSEVAKTIIGEMQADSGEIIYQGRPIRPRSSRESIGLGIVYLPEDRRSQGLFFIRSIKDNISASILQYISSGIGKINSNLENSVVSQIFQKLAVKAPSIDIPVSSLSGGNQQKVVLGRNLTLKPKLLILDEPTHGIDVGTKNEIHKLIFELANQEIAILVITSDLPEALAIADTFVVLHEGHLMGILDRQEATEELILRLALGINGNNRRQDEHHILRASLQTHNE